MIVKKNLTAIDMKTEVKLFVYFQNSNEKRFDQQETTNKGFALVRAMPGDQETAKDRCKDEEYMERAVGSWDGHLCVK